MNTPARSLVLRSIFSLLPISLLGACSPDAGTLPSKTPPPAVPSAPVVVAAPTVVDAGAPQTPDQRAESLLRQMSLEEKIDYIGGERGFYIRPIARLGNPGDHTMSDGPGRVPQLGADHRLSSPRRRGSHVRRSQRREGGIGPGA